MQYNVTRESRDQADELIASGKVSWLFMHRNTVRIEDARGYIYLVERDEAGLSCTCSDYNINTGCFHVVCAIIFAKKNPPPLANSRVVYNSKEDRPMQATNEERILRSLESLHDRFDKLERLLAPPERQERNQRPPGASHGQLQGTPRYNNNRTRENLGAERGPCPAREAVARKPEGMLTNSQNGTIKGAARLLGMDSEQLDFFVHQFQPGGLPGEPPYGCKVSKLSKWGASTIIDALYKEVDAKGLRKGKGN